MTPAYKPKFPVATLQALYRARYTVSHQAAMHQANRAETAEQQLQIARDQLSQIRIQVIEFERRSGNELSQAAARAGRITLLQELLAQKKQAYREAVGQVYQCQTRLQAETTALHLARQSLRNAQTKLDNIVDLSRRNRIRTHLQVDLQNEWDDELTRNARIRDTRL